MGDIAAESQGAPVRIMVYPSAYHAFDAAACRLQFNFQGITSNSINRRRTRRPMPSRFLQEHIGKEAKAP